jgi:hypothetical protein
MAEGCSLWLRNWTLLTECSARMPTHTHTPLAAVAARRVLAGERRAGFETPGRMFGVGFAETIAGTTITDL